MLCNDCRTYIYIQTNLCQKKDFILRKSEISDRLKNINAQLGLITQNPDSLLSDEEFIKQASHLLIQKELKGRKYIYYKKVLQPQWIRKFSGRTWKRFLILFILLMVM